MKFHITFLIALISTCLFLSNCSKNDTDNCSNEQEFCQLIDEQNFNQTKVIIDNYLASLEKNKPTENLKKLAEWLNCKSCVNSAAILCNSCMESDPPQSAIEIEFITENQPINLTMNVIMDNHLKVSAFNE